MFTDFHLGATPKLNGENFRNPGPLARESDWVRLPQEGLGVFLGDEREYRNDTGQQKRWPEEDYFQLQAKCLLLPLLLTNNVYFFKVAICPFSLPPPSPQ